MKVSSGHDGGGGGGSRSWAGGIVQDRGLICLGVKVR